MRARGLKPPIEEHAAIVRALKRRDPDAARAAMHEHISRVIEDLLEVTEVEEIERRAPWPPRSGAAIPRRNARRRSARAAPSASRVSCAGLVPVGRLA